MCISGGLHHALRSRASGFCVYNDAGVAIARLKRENPGIRIAYLDTDAHHGDGVQWMFYEDPEVLTLSMHESGRYLFPGTGGIDERGRKAGIGRSEEHTSELQSRQYLVCRLLLEKKKKII